MPPVRVLARFAAIRISGGDGPKQDLAQLRSRQVELLGRAADVLAPQGRLVYATCSSEPEENESVIEQFLIENPDFDRVDLRASSPLLDPFIDAGGMLHTLPFAHGLEAFFAAAVESRSGTLRVADRRTRD